MSKRNSIKMTSLAGAVSGLLAVAIGVWYVQAQRPATPAAAAAAAAAPIATPATPAATFSREQAVQKLMELPELKRWADNIEQRSGGHVHGALIEYDPAPRQVNGKPYYQLSFVENGDDAAQAHANFLVALHSGEILVEDDLTGELLSLDKWRQSLKD